MSIDGSDSLLPREEKKIITPQPGNKPGTLLIKLQGPYQLSY